MSRHYDEDSGRSSCSAASIGVSPIIDIHPHNHYEDNYVRKRYTSKTCESFNTELKVSTRPRSCADLIGSPDERDPFPSSRKPRTAVLSLFEPRKGGLSDAHSTLDIAHSTQIDHPPITNNAVSLNFIFSEKQPLNSNFRRTKPVQRAASRLYRADVPKGQKFGCVGPEFVVRASQPAKHINLTLSSHGEKRPVTVVLLNGQKVEVICDPVIVTAGHLFEALVHSEKYEHNFMLGIAVLIGGDFVFLPDDYKLKKIAPEYWHSKSNVKKNKTFEDTNFTVFMRIKFFLPTNIARNIQGGEWRYRVYLQLRRATVEGQLTSTLQNLTLLAGYALHIEFGEFSYRDHGSADYFLLEHYLPESLIGNNMLDVKLRMKRAHESRKGLDRNKAIINYITLAQTFRDYGAHFYSAVWATRDGFCRDVWLSIGPKGVTIYSRNNHFSDDIDTGTNPNRIVLQNLPWHHIHTFYFNKKSLYIMPNSNSGISKSGLKYKLKMHDNKSYFAFWLTSLHHRLYLKLYAKEDFINYLSDELSCPLNKDGTPKKANCSNYDDSYNLAVRNPVRMRRLAKRKFRMDIFNDKKVQNKENHKPSTEELLRQILSPQVSDDNVNSSPRSNTQGNSSNDGLSSSESCSLPRRQGVKMGTRVFNGMRTVTKYPKSPIFNLSKELTHSGDMTTTTQSDSDDNQRQHCNVNSMKLLPERQYVQTTNNEPTAYVIESPKVYPDAFNYNANTNESLLSMSLFEKLDTMGCVQGERVFVTAVIQRDHSNAIGLQVAEGSDGNVYIKSITPGGPAYDCQKLTPGDQIISVNGQTLLNMKYEKALELLQAAPKRVELIVLQNITKTPTDAKAIDSQEASSNKKMFTKSLVTSLDELDLTDDELINEEALKTIYALIKLTKEKVISKMKDREDTFERRHTSNNLKKCHSTGRVYEESELSCFSSQENTPQKKDNQKFNSWRVQSQSRSKLRPLSLCIPSDSPMNDDYENLMKITSLKSVQSSINSLDNKSIKSNSSKTVALPRNFGLSRKWLGPVKYPVTPCKNSDDVVHNDTKKKHFIYGFVNSDEDQIFI